jgi:hypothetical protein
VSKLLLSTFAGTTKPKDLTPRAWEQLLIEAQKAMVTARLAAKSIDEGWYEKIPLRPRRHLEAARRSCESQQHSVFWELRQIARALSNIDAPIVLLKGSAYVVTANRAARGRTFSDIDLMVPKEYLQEVEAALVVHGWVSNVSEYDRRYYERWMHELPALQHVQRSSVIDLHHTIAPPLSRMPVDAQKLFSAACPIAGSRFFTLAPNDMLLHSALHLLQEGDFSHGIRDLIDIDALFREFGTDPRFLPSLVERAQELDLTRLLYYAVKQAQNLLRTPLPETFLNAIERCRPMILTRWMMGSLIAGALQSSEISRRLLYIRGHYMRMPLRLLIPHLARKTGIRLASLANRRDQAIPVGGQAMER